MSVAPEGKRRITVVVHPRATRQRLEVRDGSLHVWVGPAPVDGAANDALIEAVAEHFGLPRAAVRLVAGRRSRLKTLELDGGGPRGYPVGTAAAG